MGRGGAFAVLIVLLIACLLIAEDGSDGTSTTLTDDDFTYYVSDGTAILAGYAGTDKAVVIPDTVSDGTITYNVTTLYRTTFQNNTILESITIPKSIIVIQSESFQNCIALTTVIFSDETTLETIPDRMFEGCVSLENINLPPSLVRLESESYYASGSAFKGCTSLVTISIPDNVTDLGAKTFQDCTSLVSINIGNGSKLTTMGDYAFVNCSSLRSLYIPADVSTSPRYIWGSDFSGCLLLESFTVHPDNSKFCSQDGILYSKTVVDNEPTINNLIKYPAGKAGDSFTVPSTVSSLSYNAFENSKLKSIDLSGTTVSSLITDLFKDCTQLSEISFPTTLKSIDSTAFDGCNSISSFIIPVGNTYYSTIDGVLFNSSASTLIRYPIAKTGTSYILPETVKTISESAFQGCDELTSIFVSGPLGTIDLGENAFEDCSTSLKTFINGRASCTSLEIYSDAAFVNEVKDLKSYSGKLYLRWDGETPVGGYKVETTFTYNDYGKTVMMSYSGTETNVVLPDTLGGADLVELGEALFRDRTDLVSIVVPDSVTIMGDSIFEDCTALTTVSLPSSLTTMPDYAFVNCTSLGSIVIPESVTSIGQTSFKNCVSITTLEIPYNVTEIKGYAFKDCRNLKTVTIEADNGKYKLGSIGACAFQWCSKLESINLPSSISSLGDHGFEGCVSLKSIDIPSVYEIPDYFLYGCTGLTEIAIADGTGNIGNYSLQFCSSLTELTIPGTVQTIGTQALAGLTSLKTVSMTPNTVVHFSVIDNVLFELDDSTKNPYELRLYPSAKDTENYSIPTGVVWVDDYAMIDNPYLKNLTIPSSVDTIGTSVNDWFLVGYSSLEYITVLDGNDHFLSKNGVLFNKDGTILVKFPAKYKVDSSFVIEYTVPDEVVSLYDFSFELASHVENIILPDSVIHISNCCFLNCTSLKKIEFGDGVSSVDDLSFDGCSSLSVIIMNIPAEGRVITVSPGAIDLMGNAGMFRSISGTDAVVTSYEYVAADENYDVEYTLTDNYYTIEFNPNGGYGEMEYMTVGIDVAVDLIPNMFANNDSVFSDWNTTANGTGTVYDDCQSVKNLGTAGSIVTLYAQWNQDYYTIRFDSNRGTGSMDEMVVSTGSTVNLPSSEFINTPMVFNGWNTAVDGSGIGYFEGQSVKDIANTGSTITLYAQWKMWEYIIDYRPNGGIGTMDNQTVEPDAGDKLKTNMFTKDNNTFCGWNTAADGTGVYYGDGETVIVDMFMGGTSLTLYAQWEPSRYTVVFFSNCENDESHHQMFTYGVSGKLDPNSFTNNDCTFIGWNTAADGTGIDYIDGQTVINLTDEDNGVVNLYAQWQKSGSYTIRFNPNGGTGTMSDMVLSFGQKTELTINTFTNGQYFFDSWNTSADGGGISYPDGCTVSNVTTTPDNVVTLYAQWYDGEYTVKLDSNGGTGEQVSFVIDVGGSGQIPLTVPYVREGYTFIGWNSTVGGDGVGYTKGQMISGLSTTNGDEAILYAQWKINQYTITFDTMGGSTVLPIIQDYGTTVTAPTNPTKEGFTFSDWIPSLPVTMPAEDLTVTAEWNGIEYAFMFVDSDGEEICSTIYGYVGTSITEPDDPEMIGYTFTGWDVTIPDTMPIGGGKAVAQWKVNQYTITFNAAGGTNVPSITQDYGTPITEPSDPSRTGYRFMGWSTSIPDTMPANNMTITAQWKSTSSGTSGGSSALPVVPTPSPQQSEADDEVDETVTIIENPDGSTTTITSEINNNDEGSITSTTTESTVAQDGTSSSKVTEISESESGTVKIVTETLTDAEGNKRSSTKMEATSSDGSVKTTMESSTDENGETESTITSIVSATDEGEGNMVVEDMHIDVAIGQITYLSVNDDGMAPAVINIPVGDSDSASVSSEAMANLSDAGVGLKVSGITGSVHLDSDVCENLSSADGRVRISIGGSNGSDLTDRQKDIVGDRPAFVIKVESDSGYHHELGGQAIVCIPHEPLSGEDPSSLRMFHVDDDGNRELMESYYDTDSREMVMVTPHFSVFVIDVETEEPAVDYVGVPTTVMMVIVALAIAAVCVFAFIRQRN